MEKGRAADTGKQDKDTEGKGICAGRGEKYSQRRARRKAQGLGLLAGVGLLKNICLLCLGPRDKAATGAEQEQPSTGLQIWCDLHGENGLCLTFLMSGSSSLQIWREGLL